MAVIDQHNTLAQDSAALISPTQPHGKYEYSKFIARVAYSLPKTLLKELPVTFQRHKRIQKNWLVMLYRLRKIYGVSQRCFSRGCRMPWIQIQLR